jgi:outer membrane beta-barrel protein
MTSTRPTRFALTRFTTLATSSVALLAFAFVAMAPRAAQAQRVSPLADAPAIRKRVELREKRFEAGVGFASTLGQDYYHSMFLDLKLDIHLTDWLSIGAVGGFAVANMQTAYGEQLVNSLHAMNPPAPREPTKDGATASMQKINSILAAQLEFTPFTGKFALAGAAFAHYDFYAFGGFGALVVAPGNAAGTTACASAGTATSCSTSGLLPGGTFGVGAHAFIKQWLALNLEVRDIYAHINPSGRDVNGDGVATTADARWGSTYVFALNLAFYLPSAAVISQ